MHYLESKSEHCLSFDLESVFKSLKKSHFYPTLGVIKLKEVKVLEFSRQKCILSLEPSFVCNLRAKTQICIWKVRNVN